MKPDTSNSYGGKRSGAGRKQKYNQATKTIRLPIDLVFELKQLNVIQIHKLTQQLADFRKNIDH